MPKPVPTWPTIDGRKKCSDCLVEKPLEDFYARSNTKSTRNPYCKSCHVKRIRINEYKRGEGHLLKREDRTAQ
jgi:hypothetical protein